MFWWIVISTPFLLLFIALCLPFTLTLSVSSEPTLVVEGRASWALWRSKPFRFDPAAPIADRSKKTTVPKAGPSPTVAKLEPAAAPESAAPKSKARKRERQQERLPLSGTAIYELLKKYFPRLWRALHWRCLGGELYLAVTDPATYGWIFAFLGVTNWPRPPVRLQVELGHQLTWQVDAQWRLRIYPIQWLGLALRIAWEPAIRPLWWSKLRKKGESKRARSQSVRRTVGESHIQQDGHRRSYLSG